MMQKNTRQVLKCGFGRSENMIHLTDGQLAALKQVLLGMLADLTAFFERHSLSYTLSGGSVLGTIRHGGFIPWDDDIDINMPRRDYDRMTELFDGELGERYELCTPAKTHNHGMLCAQVKLRGTVYRSFNELSKAEEDCGICVDLFIVENTFNNPLARKLHGALCLAVGYGSTCRKTYADYPYLQPYLVAGTEAEAIFRKKARRGKLLSWLSLDTVTRFADRCYRLCRNDQSAYVTIPGGRGHYFGEMLLRTELCAPMDAEFEGMAVKIPAGYPAYMRALYGEDYMTPPPEEKRERHPLMGFRLPRDDTRDEADV